jgi:hypothetical protein
MAEDRHRSRVIVTSVRADLTSGPLVRFIVNGDGTATGRMVPMGVQFMEVRSQRTAGTPDDDFDWQDDSADHTITTIKPWLMFSDIVSHGPPWSGTGRVDSWFVRKVFAACGAKLRTPTVGGWTKENRSDPIGSGRSRQSIKQFSLARQRGRPKRWIQSSLSTVRIW